MQDALTVAALPAWIKQEELSGGGPIQLGLRGQGSSYSGGVMGQYVPPGGAMSRKTRFKVAGI